MELRRVVGVQQLIGQVIRTKPSAPRRPIQSHESSTVDILEHPDQRMRKRRFGRLGQHASHAIADDFSRSVRRHRDTRHSRVHRLDEHQAKRVILRRKGKEVGSGIVGGHFRVGNFSGENDLAHPRLGCQFSDRRFVRPAANDEQPIVEVFRNLGDRTQQELDPLLRRNPSSAEDDRNALRYPKFLPHRNPGPRLSLELLVRWAHQANGRLDAVIAQPILHEESRDRHTMGFSAVPLDDVGQRGFPDISQSGEVAAVVRQQRMERENEWHAVLLREPFCGESGRHRVVAVDDVEFAFPEDLVDSGERPQPRIPLFSPDDAGQPNDALFRRQLISVLRCENDDLMACVAERLAVRLDHRDHTVDKRVVAF